MNPLLPKLLLLGALSVAPDVWANGGVVVLTQNGVPQFVSVVSGFKETRGDAKVVDVADAAALAAALAGEPSAVVAVGTRALTVAREHGVRAPLVVAAVLNPQPLGAEALSAIPLEPRAAETVRVMSVLVPNARRILALHPATAQAALSDAVSAAQGAGVKVDFRPLKDLAGFQDMFRAAIDGYDAVWLLADVRLARPELVKFMVSTCLERKVAMVGFMDAMTRMGALAAVSSDFEAIGREAGRLAGELAKAGKTKVASAYRFVPGKVSVNVRTREALGLPERAVPAEAELIR